MPPRPSEVAIKKLSLMGKIINKTVGFKILIIGAIGLLFGAGGWFATKKFLADETEQAAPRLISAGRAAECTGQVIGENKENPRAELFVNCGGFLE